MRGCGLDWAALSDAPLPHQAITALVLTLIHDSRQAAGGYADDQTDASTLVDLAEVSPALPFTRARAWAPTPSNKHVPMEVDSLISFTSPGHICTTMAAEHASSFAQ